MGQYLNKRITQLLRVYLKICGACGFVVLAYNDRRKCIETARWQQRAAVVFAFIYFPIAWFSLWSFLKVPHSCDVLIFRISMAGAHVKLIFIVMLQLFYHQRLVDLLNEFPNIMGQVHSITRRDITFSRMFGIRSVLQFVPMLIIFFNILIYRPRLTMLVVIVVVKLMPDILVEMLHHSVHIGLYTVAKMYQNLNDTLASKGMEKSEKIIKGYCELHRLTEKLNSCLYGYFLLHFFLDCVMLSSLIVTISLECSSRRSMLFLAATTLNRMRTLMLVADEITDRSRFFNQNGEHLIEFSLVRMHLGVSRGYTIDKKLFMNLIGKIFLFLMVTNQFVSYDPDGYSNYINSTHLLSE